MQLGMGYYVKKPGKKYDLFYAKFIRHAKVKRDLIHTSDMGQFKPMKQK